MKSLKIYFSLALIIGLTSVALAEPYSQTWEESNLAPAVSASVVSEYTLGWQDAGKEAAPEAQELVNVVEAPVAVHLAQLPGLISAASGGATLAPGGEVASAGIVGAYASAPRSLRGPSSVSVPSHDITLHADRYYDNYSDNYRYVSKVEVVTYRGGRRGGYPSTDTYENYAQYSTYDVYINDLTPGDRYEVRVTWDDGSYRIIERSVDRYPDHNVRVSEPG